MPKLRPWVFTDLVQGNGHMIQYDRTIKVQVHPLELARMIGDLKKSDWGEEG